MTLVPHIIVRNFARRGNPEEFNNLQPPLELRRFPFLTPLRPFEAHKLGDHEPMIDKLHQLSERREFEKFSLSPKAARARPPGCLLRALRSVDGNSDEVLHSRASSNLPAAARRKENRCGAQFGSQNLRFVVFYRNC